MKKASEFDSPLCGECTCKCTQCALKVHCGRHTKGCHEECTRVYR